MLDTDITETCIIIENRVWPDVVSYIVKLVLLHFRQVIVMKWIYSFCIAGDGGAQALNWGKLCLTT